MKGRSLRSGYCCALVGLGLIACGEVPIGTAAQSLQGECIAPEIEVCHRTASAKNPVVYICVADDARAAHIAHGDTIRIGEACTDAGTICNADSDCAGFSCDPETTPVCNLGVCDCRSPLCSSCTGGLGYPGPC